MTAEFRGGISRVADRPERRAARTSAPPVPRPTPWDQTRPGVQYWKFLGTDERIAQPMQLCATAGVRFQEGISGSGQLGLRKTRQLVVESFPADTENLCRLRFVVAGRCQGLKDEDALGLLR